MTIETNLERIATALEGILSAQLTPLIVNAEQAASDRQYAEDIAPVAPKTYAETRKAEVKAEAKAAAPEPEKKPRGRPRKETVKAVEPEPEATPEVETEEDPFAEEDTPPAAPAKKREVTKEELRKVMVDMRNKLGKDKAYALLRENGNGATFLPGSTASGASGGAGELKPEFFLAVVEAAEAAMQ